MKLILRIFFLFIFQQYFSYIMATSFSGGGSRSSRKEPPSMGKQDPGFQVRGGDAIKNNCAEWREARKYLEYFVWKITILRQKIIFFPLEAVYEKHTFKFREMLLTTLVHKQHGV
jgi:hypothetical protein